MIKINFPEQARRTLARLAIAAATPVSLAVSAAGYPQLDGRQLEWIGGQIFNNECNRSEACLTAWNEGENFPSMGIGHFIWYRSGQEEIFTESFPALMQFLEARGLAIPGWIVDENYESPWQTREAFLADFDGDKLKGLRSFLNEHTSDQTAFIVSRFETALDAMGESIDTGPDRSGQELKARLAENFHAVANSHPPYGLYAMIDYVNFKGTGISAAEKYQGQGWGLKQVLLGMDPAQAASGPLSAFVASARQILQQRVTNAPPARNETRWLAGWLKRLDTYLPDTGDVPVQ